jgi:hypothetical protein
MSQLTTQARIQGSFKIPNKGAKLLPVIDEILERRIPDERHRDVDQEAELLLNRYSF